MTHNVFTGTLNPTQSPQGVFHLNVLRCIHLTLVQTTSFAYKYCTIISFSLLVNINKSISLSLLAQDLPFSQILPTIDSFQPQE